MSTVTYSRTAAGHRRYGPKGTGRHRAAPRHRLHQPLRDRVTSWAIWVVTAAMTAFLLYLLVPPAVFTPLAIVAILGAATVTAASYGLLGPIGKQRAPVT